MCAMSASPRSSVNCSIVHQMQTSAVARGSGESGYLDLTGVGACCIQDHHFDERFVSVLRGVVRFSRDC